MYIYTHTTSTLSHGKESVSINKKMGKLKPDKRKYFSTHYKSRPQRALRQECNKTQRLDFHLARKKENKQAVHHCYEWIKGFNKTLNLRQSVSMKDLGQALAGHRFFPAFSIRAGAARSMRESVPAPDSCPCIVCFQQGQ